MSLVIVIASLLFLSKQQPRALEYFINTSPISLSKKTKFGYFSHMWHRFLGARQWIPKQFLLHRPTKKYQVGYSFIQQQGTSNSLNGFSRQLANVSYVVRNEKLLQLAETNRNDLWRISQSLWKTPSTMQLLSLKTSTGQQALGFNSIHNKNSGWKTRSSSRPCTNTSTVSAKEETKHEGDQQGTKEPQFLIYDAKKGWHFFFLTFLSSSQLGIWLAEKLNGKKKEDENPSFLARNISGIASVVGLVCLALVFIYSRNFISEMWIVGRSAQKLIIRTYTIVGTKSAAKQLLTKSLVKGRSKGNSNYVGIKFKGAKFSYILDKGGRFIANEELINSFENGASAVFVAWSRVYPTLKHTATRSQ